MRRREDGEMKAKLRSAKSRNIKLVQKEKCRVHNEMKAKLPSQRRLAKVLTTSFYWIFICQPIFQILNQYWRLSSLLYHLYTVVQCINMNAFAITCKVVLRFDGLKTISNLEPILNRIWCDIYKTWFKICFTFSER